MYTLENCEKLWEEAGQHGTVAERIARTEKWFPYYRYLARSAATAPLPAGDAPSPFVAYLLREGVLSPECSVLDIGAGMGGYALEFGRFCRSVTALEPCGDCLALLSARAERSGLGNITAVEAPWEEYRTGERFDVTFSAMCPAICNVDELRRMEAMTRETCCLIAVTRGSCDKHRKAMMAELGVKPQGGMTTEAIHYINALYLMGRQPSVKCFTSRHISRIPREKVLEQYAVYFSIFGIKEEESLDYLRGYLDRNAKGGFLEDESLLHQALIYWRVPQEEQ